MTDEGKVIEAVAVPIDPPEVVGLVDRLVAQAAEAAARWGDDFMPREPKDEDEYRQVSRERSALHKEIMAVKDGRRALFSGLKDAIRQGEQRVNDAIAGGERMDAEYKAGIDAYKARVVAERLAEVEQEYAEMAPDLVPLVPFGRIDAKWGGPGKWHNFSTSLAKVRQGMEEAVSEIARNERLIAAMGQDPDTERRLREIYFQTLDFHGACAQAQEEREQRERVRALDEARAERLRAAQEAASEPQAEARPEVETSLRNAPAEPQEAAGGPRLEWVGRSAPEPTPEPQEAPDAPSAGMARVLVFEVEVPEERAREFVEAMRSIDGCHGRKVREIWR